MASESILKALFEVAKNSLYFKGLSENEIRKACLKYKDRPDTDIEIAMENIRVEDQKILQESEKKQGLILQNKEKIGTLREQESKNRQEDAKNASEVLDDFFKL